MRVRDAVLSTLALLPVLGTTGCPTTWNCHPPKEEFSIDQPVTTEDVDAILDAYSNDDTSRSPGTVECRHVCRHKYMMSRRWATGEIRSCELTLPPSAGEAGQITCSGTGYEYLCEGRRPLEHAEAEVHGSDPTGRGLAAMAYLEAASVIAFEELAAWLEAHEAPAELALRCRRAADDERHHARWLTRLTRERGVAVPTPARPSASTRATPASLLEVATHNAVEGCVHESFAALMAAIRARRSTDLRMRCVLAKIAADETRHGQLAWDLHAWIRSQLCTAEVREVDAAQRQAMTELPQRARALQAVLPPELAGLPGEHAERVAAAFVERLAA